MIESSAVKADPVKLQNPDDPVDLDDPENPESFAVKKVRLIIMKKHGWDV